ncbi:hypothetical protein LCGC14_2360860 [marine sediment metagenome]|uniref:Uncharacterized protein n=1 Tax=marine sediment metagenome TaxID=412755 RepID=A0A0F9EJ60_9ZZZZ
MSTKLRTGELTKTMNLLVKADIDLCEADIRFLKFCREHGYIKLTGVLVKDGVVVMADTVRHDIRFDIESGT